MNTRHFWILAGLFVGLVLAGLFARSGLVMALAFPLLVYLGMAIFYAPGEIRMQVTRDLSTDRASQGVPVTANLHITNEGDPLQEVHLSDQLPRPIQRVEGPASRTACLSSGESVDLEYIFQSRRGRCHFESVKAQAFDPFGLFEKEVSLPAAGEVLFFPHVPARKSISIRPSITKGFSGPINSRKSGAGMDFYGIRQYQLGDSLRHINWKSSARNMVDLFTNEYEQERIADVGLVLDARLQSDVEIPGKRLFEYSVQATAALADAFLDDGHCVSMLVFGSGIIRVFPGYGKSQRERIFNTLASVDTGLNYALERLRYLPTQMLPPHCQLVMISPLMPDDMAPLLRFRSQGYDILVVSADPISFEQSSFPTPLSREIGLAIRLARLERDLQIANLKNAGIQVADWKVDEPFVSVIDQARYQYQLHHQILRGLA